MQNQQPSNPFGLDRFRGVINGFVAGIIVGAILGWFFHGFVSLVIRFGLVVILLIPIAIMVWFFFLRRPAPPSTSQGSGGMQVFTWSSTDFNRRNPPARQAPPADPAPDRSARGAPDSEIIDIEFEELKRQVRDEEPRP